MHKFTKGYFYHFKSMHDHCQFTQRCNDNRVFAIFVGCQPFKVLEVDDYGNAQKIENHAKEIKVMHLDAVNELDYFAINYDMAWCVNAGYQLKDAEALVKYSSINLRFIREIGYNPFIVESVTIHGIHDLKTMCLKYVNPNDRTSHLFMNFTLTADELKHFEEWKHPILAGFIRGEAIIHELPQRNTFFKPCGEVMHPEYAIATREEAEADCGKTKAEIMQEIAHDTAELKTESPKIEVKGKIRFVVEDEMTRLKAIEFLNNMVFK